MWNWCVGDTDPCWNGTTPETNVKNILIHASLEGPQFAPSTSLAAMRGQAFKLKGHIKSKGPSCNQRGMLHGARVSQAHRWKRLAPSLQGHLAQRGMCSRIILPRGASQLRHEDYSTTQQQHDMLFLHHVCPYVISLFTVEGWAKQPKSYSIWYLIWIILYRQYIDRWYVDNCCIYM